MNNNNSIIPFDSVGFFLCSYVYHLQITIIKTVEEKCIIEEKAFKHK